MISIEICIDVPDIAQGIRFYEDAFGYSKGFPNLIRALLFWSVAPRQSHCLKNVRGAALGRMQRMCASMVVTGRPYIWTFMSPI